MNCSWKGVCGYNIIHCSLAWPCHISVQACLYLKIDPKLQDRISNIEEIGALNEYLIGPDCNNQLTKYIMVSIIYQALVDEDLWFKYHEWTNKWIIWMNDLMNQ